MGITEKALALQAALGMRDDFLKPLKEEFDTYINFSNGDLSIQKLPRHHICYFRGTSNCFC